MKFKDLIIETSCPIDEPYGGMSTGGGYSSNTEYEIGAQRMAEALHCILGSLFRDRISMKQAEKNKYKFESYSIGHIKEEFGIVEDVLKEYSRDIYTRTIDGRQDNGYSKQSIESMKKTSPKLIKLAKSKMRKLNKKDMPESMYKLAYVTYAIMVLLGESVLHAVKSEPYTNAFNNSKLKQGISVLKKAVQAYIK